MRLRGIQFSLTRSVCHAAVLLATSAAWAEPKLERFEYEGMEMAVPVRMVVYAAQEKAADKAVRAAFDRIHALNGVMSDYDAQSEIRRLCETAGQGKAFAVSEDLFRVLAASKRWAERSRGAFDPTIGQVVRLWRRARRQRALPSEERLTEARRTVGHELMELDSDKRTVRLAREGTRLDLGGIAKGFAIDEALRVLAERGIERALVDAGGDIRLGKGPPDKQGWRIGVAALEPEGEPSRYLCLAGRAIATSGDTWQFVEIGGRRYSHIVDPRTGVGLTDHSSVTVVARDGMTADALATAISVLGPGEGMKLADRTPGAAALVVQAPDGKPETFESERWNEIEAGK